jgi:uncharacterized protein
MKRIAIFLLALSLTPTVASAQVQAPLDPGLRAAKYPPTVDSHQHVFSPAMAELQAIILITAGDVIALLDAAGIERGVLLSTAYSFGRPGREPQDEYAKVMAENDWVGSQAALYPRRLIAFCSFNPLKDYALEEITRCAKVPSLRRGIKLHFGNSDVQLENPEHVGKLKQVFSAANANRMAIVVHMRASISLKRPYGAQQARVFLEELLPLARNTPVQVAHLAGTGPGYNDPKADAVLEVFADAIGRRDPRTRTLWFDVATVAHPSNPQERSALLAERIRRIGVERVLYGSDAALGSNLRPKDAWTELSRLALSDKELKKIAGNRAPYWR